MSELQDKMGWPIETIQGRPIQNIVRLICQWLRGNWYGGRFGFLRKWFNI